MVGVIACDEDVYATKDVEYEKYVVVVTIRSYVLETRNLICYCICLLFPLAKSSASNRGSSAACSLK